MTVNCRHFHGVHNLYQYIYYAGLRESIFLRYSIYLCYNIGINNTFENMIGFKCYIAKMPKISFYLSIGNIILYKIKTF